MRGTHYWKKVEEEESEGSGYLRRETFEHALPDGSVLVLVRMADLNSESVALVHAPVTPKDGRL